MNAPRSTPARVIAGMTMSLDGFVADAQGRTGALYADLADWRHTESGKASIEATGAVLMGRKTFEMAPDPDSFADLYEYQVPIFVLSRAAPSRHPRENANLTFIFVPDGLASALDKARAASGRKRVTVVGGPTLIQGLLRSAQVDELEVDIMPVLFGGGLRLFDHLDPGLRLERIGVTAAPHGRTQLRYTVHRRDA